MPWKLLTMAGVVVVLAVLGVVLSTDNRIADRIRYDQERYLDVPENLFVLREEQTAGNIKRKTVQFQLQHTCSRTVSEGRVYYRVPETGEPRFCQLTTMGFADIPWEVERVLLQPRCPSCSYRVVDLKQEGGTSIQVKLESAHAYKGRLMRKDGRQVANARVLLSVRFKDAHESTVMRIPIEIEAGAMIFKKTGASLSSTSDVTVPLDFSASEILLFSQGGWNRYFSFTHISKTAYVSMTVLADGNAHSVQLTPTKDEYIKIVVPW